MSRCVINRQGAVFKQFLDANVVILNMWYAEHNLQVYSQHVVFIFCTYFSSNTVF